MRELAAFAKYARSGLVLSLNQEAVIDIQLKIARSRNGAGDRRVALPTPPTRKWA